MRLAAQGVLVLVIGRFQGLFGLLGRAAALGQRFQLLGQRLGAGAAGIQTDIPLGRAEAFQPERMVAQQVAGSAVRDSVPACPGCRSRRCGRRMVSAYWAASGFSLRDLRGKTVGGGESGRPAVGRADARGVQQADGADLVPQGHKGALGGGIVGRRHEDVEPAVAEAGFHAVLPALVLDGSAARRRSLASGVMPRLCSSAFTASRTLVAASPWG